MDKRNGSRLLFLLTTNICFAISIVLVIARQPPYDFLGAGVTAGIALNIFVHNEYTALAVSPKRWLAIPATAILVFLIRSICVADAAGVWEVLRTAFTIVAVILEMLAAGMLLCIGIYRLLLDERI